MKALRYIILLILMLSCSSPTDKEQPENDNSVSVSKVMSAIEGGTLEFDDGTNLYICPDALKENTEITMSKINDLNAEEIACLNFGPNGLDLEKPAILTVPITLPSDWKENDMLFVYETYGDGEYYWNGQVAWITTENGRNVAKSFITHFSKQLFVRNCHSGTLKVLLEQFEKMGCDSKEAINHVKNKYPSEK